MSSPVDVAAELAELTAALHEFASLRAAERFPLAAPHVSGWSPAQHLYHVALATDLALDNVRRIVHRLGVRVVDEGGLNEGAVQVFEENAIPRGVAQAPRMVVPADEVEPELLEQELARAREAAQDTRELLDVIPGATGRIKHPLLGELSAVEWLRFGNIHTRHHLAIAREILDV